MSTPIWYSRLLIGGETGNDVMVINRKLGVGDWVYSETSIQYVRGLQAAAGLPVTGVVDPDTARVLGEAADHQLPPTWFRRPLAPGSQGEDVATLRQRLSTSSGDTFDVETERAVRRFQSSRGLPLTGHVDEGLAILLP